MKEFDTWGECPTCGYTFTKATGVGHDEGPSKGDYTLCISCGELLVFKKNRTVRKANLAEKMHSLFHPEILEAQLRIRTRGRIERGTNRN